MDKIKERSYEIVEQTQYVVNMYKNNELVESRPMGDHSKEYAQDCGENWIIGVIDE